MARRNLERGRDQKVENWIASYGVSWQFLPDVPAGAFDVEASLAQSEDACRLLTS